jgi:hypothetical protein
MWVVGGLAGVSFYLISLPMDRVKTILMTQVPLRAVLIGSLFGLVSSLARSCAWTLPLWQDITRPVYRSATECFLDILKRCQARRRMPRRASDWRRRDGLRGLYRSCSATLMRTFVGQVVMLIYGARLQRMWVQLVAVLWLCIRLARWGAA